MRRHTDQRGPSRQALKLQQRTFDLQALVQKGQELARLHDDASDVAHALRRQQEPEHQWQSCVATPYTGGLKPPATSSVKPCTTLAKLIEQGRSLEVRRRWRHSRFHSPRLFDLFLGGRLGQPANLMRTGVVEDVLGRRAKGRPGLARQSL